VGFYRVYIIGNPSERSNRTMRTLAVATLIIGTVATLPAGEPARPLGPTDVSWDKGQAVLGAVADALEKKSGVPIAYAPVSLKKNACDVRFTDVPFWEGLQKAADASKTRIALTDGGRKVCLVPRGAAREAVATSGAFRVVAQQVVGRALLEQGITFHELYLLVHWEPRLRVYRIDTTPRITRVSDVPGSKIVVDGGGGHVLPSDATSELKVRLSGLGRTSDRITALAGEFTVTAADRMLTFSFEAPDGKLPEPQKQGGVTAALKRAQKKGDTWEIAVEVTYPEGQPTFESFQGEWWLRDNRMVLRGPDGKPFPLDDFEIPTPDNPRPLTVIYRYKEDPNKGLGSPTAKGWVIVYETPAPLAEIKVPFELKNIPLP
jgi:hypothetical protein